MSTPSHYNKLNNPNKFEIDLSRRQALGLLVGSWASIFAVTYLGSRSDGSDESTLSAATPAVDPISNEAAPREIPIPNATPTPDTGQYAIAVGTETAAIPSPSPNPH
jgi:hypothetical protein